MRRSALLSTAALVLGIIGIAFGGIWLAGYLDGGAREEAVITGNPAVAQRADPEDNIPPTEIGTPDVPGKDEDAAPQDATPGSKNRDLFWTALNEKRWKSAGGLLTAEGLEPGARLALDDAMSAAVDSIEEQASFMRDQAGARAAAAWLRKQMEAFPPESAAANRLADLVLALPTAPKQNENQSEVANKSKSTDKNEGDRVAGAGRLSAEQVITLADEVLLKRDLRWASDLYLTAEARAREEKNSDIEHRAARGLRLVQSYESLLTALSRVPAASLKRAGRVPYRSGRAAKLVGLDKNGITVASTDGMQTLKWRLVPAAALRHLALRLPVKAMALVDAAAVMYHAERKVDADALLVRAYRKHPATKDAVDRVLADARKMAVPKEGFTLLKGAWLAPQELARTQLNETVLESREDLLSNDPAKREAGFGVLRDLGDRARSSLHRGILTARIGILERMKKSPSWAPLEKMAEKRALLDKHRQAALKLIRDRVKYPYPHSKRKGASAEAVRNYRLHQPIVTRLTRALREVWDDADETTPRKEFRELVVRMQETEAWLEKAGFDPVEEEHPWIYSLSAEGSLSVRRFAIGIRDRIRIEESIRIMAANSSGSGAASRSEREQARITNEYRVMFGAWALKLWDPLVRSSRGHCIDMVRDGFFSHTSKVKGKKTPYARAVREGMKPLGVGENIAMSGSPAGAHNMWIKSPGHHRNILSPGWRIMGPGNSGSRWCQVFSAGDANEKKEQSPPPK